MKKKSQFIPNARAIVEANDITAGERQLHAELKAIIYPQSPPKCSHIREG